MDRLFFLLLNLCFAQASLALVLTAPTVFFSRRRVAWQSWELLVFLLPFVIWIALESFGGRSKSISNIGELLGISLAIPIAALVRVALAKRVPQTLLAIVLFAAVCAVAVATYFLTPFLPE